MAPLDSSNTGRVWLSYSDGINEHTMLWRFNSATSNAAEVMTYQAQWLAALDPVLYEVTITGVKAAAPGSNVSVPIAWTGDATYGTGAATAVNAPVEIRYEGRSVGGRRVSAHMYGYNVGVPGTFRIGITPASELDDALVVLQAATATGAMVAIDNGAANWHTYVNIQYNSYWEAAARP